MAKIGFLGTGEIAAAMVRGLAGQGHQILVSERNAEIAAGLAAEFDEVSVAENDAVVASSDVVFLCLMAKIARVVLPDLPFRAGQSVVSVMADMTHEELCAHCGQATDIATTIPLPFIATGGCPLPVYPASDALVALFGERNLILPVASEVALNAHFAATAMASTMFAQVETGAKWLGSATGDVQAAEAYVIAMLAGFLGSLPTDGRGRAAEALASLATEGGLNATLRAHMREGGAEDLLVQGLDSFRGRLGLSEG